MLVHFIGGPAHGLTEAIQNPGSSYTFPELRGRAIYRALDVEGALPPMSSVDFAEHRYKITRRTPRYAIAEWEAPPVDVRFEVRLEVDPSDHAAGDALWKLIQERETGVLGGSAAWSAAKREVLILNAAASNSMEFDLTLQVRVEGPEDATALELAARQVQHYLDAELPPCKQHIRQVAATT